MTCMSIFCSNYVTDMAVAMVAILYYFHLKNGLIHAMQSNGPLQQVLSIKSLLDGFCVLNPPPSSRKFLPILFALRIMTSLQSIISGMTHTLCNADNSQYATLGSDQLHGKCTSFSLYAAKL
jgi:hypothetical protein